MTGSITNSGTISGISLFGISLNSGSTIDSLTNSGTISGNSTGISLNDSTIGSLTNIDTISGGYTGIYLNASTIGSLTNSGMISGNSTGISLNASTISGGITNSGLIEGGNGVGIRVINNGTISSLTNSGTISGVLQGIRLSSTSTIGSLTNSGTISGGGYTGIRLSSTSTIGSLTNSGTISGGLHGIYLSSNSTISGGIVNNSGGIIRGGGMSGYGIRVDGSSTISGGITNSGLIEGVDGYAIYVHINSTLDSITIVGNNTAKFIGAVYAPNTPVTVASGATYTMDNGQLFTLNGTSTGFTNAGTLKVGAGDTGTITGSFTNTGTFSPTVTNTAVGKLTVSGTATLGGTLAVDASALTAGHSWGSRVSGIITAGSVSGTFASYSDNSVLFNFTPVYSATSVDLTLAAAAASGGPSVVSSITATGNTPGTGAAAALDSIIAGAPNGPIASLFVGLTTEQEVSNAVSQTLPLLVGGSQVAASAALTGINRVVQARIESNRGLSSGGEFYGDKKFWMKPFGSWADQNDRKGVSGFSARTGGLAFGADATISDITRLGISFAYAKANVDGNSTVAPNSANVDVYQLIGYGSHSLDADTEINFQAGIGQNKNDGKRNILFAGTTAKANYDSLVTTAGAGLGRSYKLNPTTSFTPSVRADYTWIKDQGYTETGAGALNLDVKGRSTDELILAIDGKLAHQYTAGTTVTANLGLGYDALNKQSSITAAFAGAPGAAFTTMGLDPSPWMVRGGLGVVSNTASGMEVSARYDAEYRQDFLNQTASVKLRWAF